MKQILIYVFLILVGLTSCKKNKNEVIVKGKFIGDIPEEIKYSIPINGICYVFFQASEKVDSLGNFEIRLNITNPCFVTFLTKGNMGQLIAEPGENYFVSIEANNRKNKYHIECKNSIVQKEYQKLISPMFPQFEARKFWDSSISVAKNKIDSLNNQEISSFEKLLSDGKISSKIFDLIKFDRTLFYNSLLEQVALYKFVNAKRKNVETNTDSINELWNEAIMRIPLNSVDILKSKWAYYHIQNYLQYKEYMKDGFNCDNRAKAREEGMIHTYLIEIAKKHLNGKVLEFYTASYIISNAWPNTFEKELIPLFESFKTDFPKSKYTTYIEPFIKKIIDFHQIAKLDFKKECKFVDNYQNLNSLDDCLQPFKGKKIYIDIWSIFCGPCKKEFEHNERLKEILKNKGVDILYISLDGDKYKNRWKDMIKYYNLSGYNIRANKKLITDLEKKFGNFAIPRYLIIDKQGKIVNNDAPRPSNIPELEKQL